MMKQLVNCIHIICKNGKSVAFTDYSEPVQFNDTEFEVVAGFKRSSIYTDVSASADNFEFEAAFDDALISEEELMSGVFDDAEINIYIYDLESTRTLVHNKGYMNILRSGDGAFKAEIRGILDLLNRSIGQSYSPQCRANFGDSKCGINTDALKYKVRVTHFDIASSWMEIEGEEDMQKYKGGIFLIADAKYQIVDAFDNKIQVLNPYHNDIASGEYFVIPGCDKSFKSCCEKWKNALNFRGEPHLKDVQLMK